MSSRLGLSDLPPRYSLLEGLPAVFHEDDFLPRFVGGFDAVLSPVHAATDDLDAYLDPRLAPPDFLEWLGRWLGLEVNRRWPIQRRREFVAQAVDVYRWRGTTEGIERAVELYTGHTPEVTDSGGVSASNQPQGDLPGSRGPVVKVVVRTPDASIDANLVDRIVAEVKPAHVSHEVQIVRPRAKKAAKKAPS